jgi:cyclohexanone monooxygenase
VNKPASVPEQFDAVVVGAGFSGLYMLYRLRQLGLSVRVFDVADDVGGTWYWNRYPGARCDVPTTDYTFSFDPELEKEWTWSEKYATQPEILDYLRFVADRHELRPDIEFSTAVTAARWDEPAKQWTITINGDREVRCRYYIMATGCLSVPKSPDIEGAARFAGPVYFTSRWPHEGVDFTGQRVAVIGTGSSGIQSIPIVARQAADLTVFQRTPNFSMPAGNRPLAGSEITEMKAAYRDWRERQRTSGFGVPVEPATQSALEVTEEQRQAAYQSGWDQGDLVSLIGSFTDTLTDIRANEHAAEFIRAQIRRIVSDPVTAEKLSPRTFPVGTKRPCLDTGYYATFNSPHVHLVDLRETPLVEFTEAGLRTSEREYEFDAIVFATGFDAMTGALTAIDIRGRDGVSLAATWAGGPRTYLGLAVARFPNLFTVTGPLSPSVLSNMVVSIEQHVDWITDCVLHLRAAGHTAIEATAAAQDGWVQHVAEVGAHTLFPTAESWYMGSNVPGKPRVFYAYIGGVGLYRQTCDQIAARGYEGFTLTGAAAVPA